MSDRVKGFWVALDREVKDEDVVALVEAIKQMRHVENVTTKKVQPDDWMIQSRVRAELREDLIKLYDKLGR